MSEQDSNDLDPSRLGPGARLRAVADGELRAEHAAGIESAEARVGFERALRASVARSMAGSDVAAPPQLREKILAILGPGAPDEPVQEGVIRTPMGDTRHPSFWSGMGRFVAIAAVLTICATVIIVASRHAGNVAHGHTLQAGLLTSFVEGEHEHCEQDRAYEQHVTESAPTLQEARTLARRVLGGVPPVLEEGFGGAEAVGFTFVGMGPCHVPGKGASVHVILEDVRSRTHLASLFIQVDRAQWKLDEEHVALLKEGLEGQEAAFVWLDGGYLHVLFVDLTSDAEVLRGLLHAPNEECDLKAR